MTAETGKHVPVKKWTVGADSQTDMDLESSYGNMWAHKTFQLKAQN